ncbi:anthranilate synthase component I [Desulfobacca acetoxidans]|uniref:Anthranilate synthase component 1 n=1 Tax=Desulfobacca acetoxidans (strain ATCC 700848 / DSM 11109 / ASRB2) TaxID=880072 RepID=F2NI46_DESAR|nr:anthranilate synthase component I [Desulfobacca acetoxidans]AEB09672.1 anthranilate synthase component I [Desulfobacca acetoxidans DSM 11109]
MVTPDFDDFAALTQQGNVVPIYQEILGDLETPVSAYKKLRPNSMSFLLESVEGGEKWGRYSFLGLHPSLILKVRGNAVTVQNNRGMEQYETVADPFAIIRQVLSRYRAVVIPDLPRFYGGLVGYLSYDMVRYIERLPSLAEDGGIPEAVLMLTDHLLIFDNVRHTIKVVALVHINPDASLESLYRQGVAGIEGIIAELRAPHHFTEARPTAAEVQLVSNMKRERFEEIVVRAKEYIAAGDAIQIVLSQCFQTPLRHDPFDLYRALRCINPSPYMFYLDLEDLKLVGASPEILVRLEGDRIELRPIAGTRRRGETPEQDKALEAELLADPKERAEHIMLVDLGRNDVGRVARIGSVKVTELFGVERYSHVMHIVSHVEGSLAEGKDALEVLRASFPAGTVSGAPKVRAMEIIEELEPTRRGPYAGAVGYLGFSGNMDFCITIRSLTVHQEQVYLQVGAGIVADSNPASEYQETVNKAQAMVRALELAAKGLL